MTTKALIERERLRLRRLCEDVLWRTRTRQPPFSRQPLTVRARKIPGTLRLPEDAATREKALNDMGAWLKKLVTGELLK